MTTSRWLWVPVRTVHIGDLWATQDGVYLHSLVRVEEESWCGDPVPHVVVWDGRLLLEDGHTRVLRAALRGEQTVQARVLRVSKLVQAA